MNYLDNEITRLRREVAQLRLTAATVSLVEPKEPTTSSIWVNTSTEIIKVWDGKNWVISGGGAFLNFTSTVVFTPSDYNSVAWAAGVITIGTTTGSTAYAIGAGSFDMTTLTYFYWQEDIPTAIQTTTSGATAVTNGGVLIAISEPNADITVDAGVTVFGAGGNLITADNIISNTITANQIASNTITGNKIAASTIGASNIAVTNLSSINANLGTITAGTITLNGAGYIRGGQTTYDTGTGFFLGYESGAYKFSIGDTDSSLTWDGSDLRVKGTLELTEVFTNKSYTVATLPVPPTTAGFNPPSSFT